jgi:energy-coupling factor transporter ATP-binding protein EcfA2
MEQELAVDPINLGYTQEKAKQFINDALALTEMANQRATDLTTYHPLGTRW